MTISTSLPSASARITIASSESVCVSVAISPIIISCLIRSGTGTPRYSETSLTVAPLFTRTASVALWALVSSGASGVSSNLRRPRRRGRRWGKPPGGGAPPGRRFAWESITTRRLPAAASGEAGLRGVRLGLSGWAMILGPTDAAAAISSIGPSGASVASTSGASSSATGVLAAAGTGASCLAAAFGFGGGCDAAFAFGAPFGLGAGGNAGSRLPPVDEGLTGAATSGSKTRLPPVSTASPGSKLRCSAAVGAGAAAGFAAPFGAGFCLSAAGVLGLVGDFAWRPPPSSPADLRILSASSSSTLDAAAVTSRPAARSASSSSRLERFCSFAISWTRLFATCLFFQLGLGCLVFRLFGLG